MLVTDATKRVLNHRRGVARLKAEGYEQISEHGDPLWKFQRGICGIEQCEITDAVVGPSQTVWIKIRHRNHE